MLKKIDEVVFKAKHPKTGQEIDVVSKADYVQARFCIDIYAKIFEECKMALGRIGDRNWKRPRFSLSASQKKRYTAAQANLARAGLAGDTLSYITRLEAKINGPENTQETKAP